MSKPRKIFLSHSSLDGVLATLLVNEIESELGVKDCVFNSSDDDAVDIGDTWFEKVIKELDEADFLIILLTESSKKSNWVAFEFGYFWHKVDPLQRNKKIYILTHQIEEIPSPFSILQYKKITVYKGLENFFSQLCQSFLGRAFSNNADLDAIIREANKTMIPIIMPVEDKSLGKFIEYLENGNWSYIGSREKNSDVLWVCSNMTDYEIKLHNAIYPQSPDRFPKFFDYPNFVDFLILGKTIHRLKFVLLDFTKSSTLLPTPLQDESQNWYWSRSSLEMKVARVIAQFNGVKPKTPEDFDRELEKFANQYGIAIVD